jgi:hypothetical protein
MTARENIEFWVQQNMLPGAVRAWGVVFADKTTCLRSLADSYSTAGLENALRCAADAYEVLAMHRCAPHQLIWNYESGRVCCTRRTDKTVLAVFLAPLATAADQQAVASLFEEFNTL